MEAELNDMLASSDIMLFLSSSLSGDWKISFDTQGLLDFWSF